jgi:hypothetical protein
MTSHESFGEQFVELGPDRLDLLVEILGQRLKCRRLLKGGQCPEESFAPCLGKSLLARSDD